MRFGLNRISRIDEGENLTGLVMGEEASDLEERASKSFLKRRLFFEFQYILDTVVGLPGEEKEIDFIVTVDGIRQAIEIDGEIGHKSQWQSEKDSLRDVLVNEALRKQNIKEIIRVPWFDLETQEKADKVFEELL